MNAPALTLVEFLTARLDEDDARARAATAGVWRWDRSGDLLSETGTVIRSVEDMGVVISDADEQHIARHAPARVLADVAAKRAMLPHLLVDGHPLTHCDRCMVLRLLALPYADHPDYRADEWAP